MSKCVIEDLGRSEGAEVQAIKPLSISSDIPVLISSQRDNGCGNIAQHSLFVVAHKKPRAATMCNPW